MSYLLREETYMNFLFEVLVREGFPLVLCYMSEMQHLFC